MFFLMILSGCGGGGGGSSTTGRTSGSGAGRVAASVTLTGRGSGRSLAQTATSTVDITITISGIYSETGEEFDPVVTSQTLDVSYGTARIAVLDVPIGVNHLLEVNADWGTAVETVKAIIPEVAEGETETVEANAYTTVLADTAVYYAAQQGVDLPDITTEQLSQWSQNISSLLAAGTPYADITPADVINFVPPVCGDGTIGAGEACDDGNTTDGDGCSSTCTAESTTSSCGDGVTDTANGETCDDGASNGTPNMCNLTCNGTTSATCGNGTVESGEACDGAGESATCNSDCSAAACGDGLTNATAGETCDDSNAVTEACAYGTPSCTVCDATCNSVAGAVSYCGDGATDSGNGETCDDGASNGTPNMCNLTCNGTTSATCGNGTVESGEACDGAGESATCNSDCSAAACGDGITNATAGETCDDSNAVTEACAYGAPSCTVCDATCNSVAGAASYCGDGATDSGNGETCDDGNAVTESCTYGQPSCTVCNATCNSVSGATSYCGDASIDVGNGEVCDTSNLNAQTCSSVGYTTGTLACSGACTLDTTACYTCGNAVVEGVETCDDGNTTGGDGCDSACQVEPVCGNTFVEGGEACDDGNLTPGDGCTETCTLETIATNAWIPIAAGDFVMGCATGDGLCAAEESPKHTVTLSAYYIQKYEVTNAQYAACVTATACTAPSSANSSTRTPYYGNATYDDYPVIFVDWTQASAYCTWLGGRLPTEAEWEKAARGPAPSESIYAWGNATPTCTYTEMGGCTGDTSQVGSHPSGASYYGAEDIIGNVGEWVNDWFGSTYYSTSPATDPTGPGTGSLRVLRSDSWLRSDYNLRASFRNSFSETTASNDKGFRCAKN